MKMWSLIFLSVLACSNIALGQERGNIRLALFVTSEQIQAYENFQSGFTWSKLQQSLRTETRQGIDWVLSRNAGFPYDMSVSIADIQRVDSRTADPWIQSAARYDGDGFVQLAEYAKSHSSGYDLAALIFSDAEQKRYNAPYGFAPIGAACSKWPVLVVNGQIFNTGEGIWSWLIAHEIGHQLGAEEGPYDKSDACYDIMSATPSDLDKHKLWSRCSWDAVEKTAMSEGLKCLGLYAKK
ncbi:uncharacterized protein LOC135499308 [Lineus longissimus]|uniref:uncharacterized protein LOC135499308 n=1 Tax=Lineus longissimus TaxID=88925 RepID=UPI002B4C47B7